MTTTLTISQGLRAVKKLKGQLASFQTRMTESVAHKSSEEPAFNFVELIDSANKIRLELIDLETRIAVANATTNIDMDGKPVSLIKAVRQLSEYKSQITFYRSLPSKAQAKTISDETDWGEDGKRHRVSIEWTCHLPEANKISVIDSFQDRFDRLNDLVEQKNHITLI